MKFLINRLFRSYRCIGRTLLTFLVCSHITNVQAFHDTPDPTYKWDYSHVNPTSVEFNFDTPSIKRDGLSTRRLVAPYSAKIDHQIKRSGDSAIRFEIRPGDRVSDGWRAEVRDLNNAIPGSTVSYAISTLIPKDFPNEPDNSFVLIQWHDQGVPWKKTDDRSPPLALRYRNGRLDLTLRYAETESSNARTGLEKVLYSKADLEQGVWHDFKFKVRWIAGQATDKTGFVQMWHNNELVTDYVGPIGYFDDLGVYVKFGIYARHNVASPHIVYHDEYNRRLNSLD